MNPRRLLLCFAVWLCLASQPVHAAFDRPRTIRLRNDEINPPPRAQFVAELSASASGSMATNGLFVVQFTGPMQPSWRQFLDAHRLELVRHIPRDAFIVKLNGHSMSQVAAMPFVGWIGRYRPEHKILKSLDIFGPSATREVRFMVSPKATTQEKLQIYRTLKTIPGRSTNSWGETLRATITGRQLAELAKSEAVLWIEPTPKPKLFDEIASKIVGGDDGTPGTPSYVNQLGFDGSGVTVAVADSGLNLGDAATMHPDLKGRVDAFLFYGNLEDASDGHGHGTHVTGIIAGDGATGEKDDRGYLYGMGVAPRSHIVAQRIFDNLGGYTLLDNNYARLVREAMENGAVIGSNSWGDEVQGRYDISAAEFDGFVRDGNNLVAGDQPYILEFSAGNSGPGSRTINSPAVGKNVIATGASENDRTEFILYASGSEVMADFSSRGPCEDGRIKPDICAPGTWISSLQSYGATDENAWGGISPNYQYQGGTSQAGPHASGAAAVFVQYYRETHNGRTPSPALVKAALINSAWDLGVFYDAELAQFFQDTPPVPNNDEGWGRVDLDNLIASGRLHEFIDQTNLLFTGQTYEHRVVVRSANEPLKITLVYTDVPGLPAALPALVNDLDLEVISPSGVVYHGNQFDNGESVPDVDAFDTINNVEGVHIAQPEAGEYIVRIIARSVSEDARRETPDFDQDFALVVSGDMPLPGEAVLILDKPAYRAGDLVNIRLFKPDLAGTPAVLATLTSSIEPTGEPVILRPFGNAGVFTGAVLTASGAASADGRLQVAHGSLIQASFTYGSPPLTLTATAVADFIGPVLSTPTVTNRFGRTFVEFSSSEEGKPTVFFGTNSLIPFTVSQPKFQTNISLELTNLLGGRTYRFAIAATDHAGNRTTNNNGGVLFSFTALTPPPILLVDSYGTDNEFLNVLGCPPIPLSGWTNTLNEIGIGYTVWDVKARGASPAFRDLAPYPIVVWHLPDVFATWSPTELTALTNYLNSGGSLFASSMQALFNLDQANLGWFRSNYLHVASYTADAGVPEVDGVESDPMTRGMSVTLDYSAFVCEGKDLIGLQTDVSEVFLPMADAAPVLIEPTSGLAAGVRYPRVGQDSKYRMVFLSFPLDAVPTTGLSPNNRRQLLQNIISFLAPGLNGVGSLALDRSAYTTPGLATLEIADSDLKGSGEVYASISTTTEPSVRSVRLTETVRPGVFRGTAELARTNAPPSTNYFRAKHGDLLTATYQEAGPNGLRTSVGTAVIDTQPPVISNVVAQSTYTEATVTWETSEFTDGLVLFGESKFLGRSAYSEVPGDLQELKLKGLQPDRIYYYKVVSQDLAGNRVEDDNNGQFHSFRTQRPLSPPFTDNFETASTNWTVFSGDGNELDWTRGVPANGLATQAHSPTNAWGTNLRRQSGGFAQTFLIGPAMFLSGGNRATLRFWHNYNFILHGDFDISHGGQVMVVTEDSPRPIPIGTFGIDESSFGWEQAEFDLTPYIGKLVYVVFYYQLISFNFDSPQPFDGWIIDDVSVAMNTQVLGGLRVSNNLAQASFTIAGPVSGTHSGKLVTVTNLPTGTYTVTWNPVTDYTTPPTATNVLSSPSMVDVAGNYTFTDANNNGISDIWEQRIFGQVSPSRTTSTDTDGDGMSDYFEFLSGTSPTNASSVMSISARPLLSGTIRVDWPQLNGRRYQLQSSSNLVTWREVVPWFTATSQNGGVTLPKSSTNAPTFFRLNTEP